MIPFAFFLFSVSLFFSNPAFARDYVAKTQIHFASLDERPGSHSLLIAEVDQKVYGWNLANGLVTDSYENRCGIDPSTWEVAAWAYPYLVSLTKNCYLDEKTHRLEPLAENTVGENAFYITFLGATTEAYYFVMNARPWSASGTLGIKKIDRRTNAVSTRLLVTSVPGYSGAMHLSEDGHWLLYTQATGRTSNQLYALSTESLAKLVQNGGTADFGSLAQHLFDFPGLSLSMSVGRLWLLYTTDRAPYLVDLRNRRTLTRYAMKEGCSLFALIGNAALLKCGNLRLDLVEAADLKPLP